jgi:hypothetical protein
MFDIWLVSKIRTIPSVKKKMLFLARYTPLRLRRSAISNQFYCEHNYSTLFQIVFHIKVQSKEWIKNYKSGFLSSFFCFNGHRHIFQISLGTKCLYQNHSAAPQAQMQNVPSSVTVVHAVVDSLVISNWRSINTSYPHSIYIPASRLAEVNETLLASLKELVSFNILKIRSYINVLKDGPSDKAGLKVGDRLIRVEQQTVAGWITSEKIRSIIRGQGGSKVNITVKRDPALPFTITWLHSTIFPGRCVISTATGYIRLNNFLKARTKNLWLPWKNSTRKVCENLFLT